MHGRRTMCKAKCVAKWFVCASVTVTVDVCLAIELFLHATSSGMLSTQCHAFLSSLVWEKKDYNTPSQGEEGDNNDNCGSNAMEERGWMIMMMAVVVVVVHVFKWGGRGKSWRRGAAAVLAMVATFSCTLHLHYWWGKIALFPSSSCCCIQVGLGVPKQNFSRCHI